MTYQDRLIEMKGGQRFLLLSMALVVIVLVTKWVVSSNLENHIYPPGTSDNADPGTAAWEGTFFLAFLSIPFLALIAYVPVSSYVKQLNGRFAGWAITVGVLILSAYVKLASVCIFYFYYWFVRDHYGISISFLASLLLVTLLWWLDAKRLFPRIFVLWFIFYLISLVAIAKSFWLNVPRFEGMDISHEEVASQGQVGRIGIRGGALSLAAGEGGAVYVGTIFGIYMSTDKGATWRYITEDMSYEDNNIYALAIDGATIYARTEKSLFTSTDNGNHWKKMAGKVTSEGSGSLAVGVDGTLYAGMVDGLFKSLDKGDHWIPVGKTKVLAYSIAVAPDGTLYALTTQGILKSVDNGANWTETSNPKIIASDIAVAQNGALYAEWYDNGIFKSTDQGMTWISRRDTKIGIREFAVAPDGVLYALTSRNLCQSTDDGSTWTVVTSIKYITWQCPVELSIKIRPA